MIIKRSIIIDGKVTSISMEPAFWEEVDYLAEALSMPWQDYIRQLLICVQNVPNRSAALREILLRQLMAEANLVRSEKLISWWRLQGLQSRREIGTHGERLFVGRYSGCDIVVDDKEVSRKHLMFCYDGEAWWGLDLESKNGLWVHNKKVSLVKLTDKTTVRIGNTELIFLGVNLS